MGSLGERNNRVFKGIEMGPFGVWSSSSKFFCNYSLGNILPSWKLAVGAFLCACFLYVGILSFYSQ